MLAKCFQADISIEMKVPKNNLGLPDPAAEAYSVLSNFDRVIEADPPFRPENVPSWFDGHGFLLDQKLIVIDATHEVIDADKSLVAGFDGGTKNALWLPSGILQHGEGSFGVPHLDGQIYMIGRRVSRGDPRVAVVLPAVFSLRRRVDAHLRDTDPSSEDITHKASKLEELDGWLQKIVTIGTNASTIDFEKTEKA